MRQDIIDEKTAPYAALLLRVSLGIMFIAHSLYLKVVVFTVPGTVQFFESLGLPGFSAYLVIAAEVIGGTALVLGVYTRPVAFALVPVLLGALGSTAAMAGCFRPRAAVGNSPCS